MAKRKTILGIPKRGQATTCALSAPLGCSPPPYELACRMLNAIGWDGNDFRLRDPVALAIAPEVERINRRANPTGERQEAHNAQ